MDTGTSDTARRGPAHTGQPPGGTVIFLNGTSSSGKSSIATELLRILDDRYFHFPVDAFHAMRSKREILPHQFQDVLDSTCRGFHRAAAGMAAGGNNIVVDHVFSQSWRVADCVSVFVPENVLLVGVRCPLPELERREGERGDRPSGLAAKQFARVHAHGIHDIECDTSVLSPLECAERIRDFLPGRPRPTAFQQLRERLLTPSVPNA
ncbi:chloramphenicol phosphotransferase CPT family protein [Streptomyces sp. NBC_00859]|uniref:chloramphenicol phosphotransferase CPT family protein n=1 Tax=Streptomyces sp. NBC_00859 TaxID=2903682 RepID=UPI00386DFA8D|nr:chloramphenicol phosphotransferase CPT family protein [Streptomyces sp. NBC_00859]